MKNKILTLLFLLLISVSVFAATNQTMKVFAVTPDDVGVTATINLTITEGTGKVYTSVDVLTGTETQLTQQIAIKVAKDFLGEKGLLIDDYDYQFEIQSNTRMVDGPSAGAAMTMMVIAAIEDKVIPENVSMTGGITEDGYVTRVGKVLEKSKQASKEGVKLFMVPMGEISQYSNDGLTEINLVDYALKNLDMKVIEVGDINTAMSYAFSDIDSLDVNNTEIFVDNYIAENLKSKDNLFILNQIAKEYIMPTESLITLTEISFNASGLDSIDPIIYDTLKYSIDSAKKSLKDAKDLYDKGYIYSAANSAFISQINTNLVYNIAEHPSIINPESSALKFSIKETKEKIQLLEDKFGEEYFLDDIEWDLGARARLLWAKNKIYEIENSSSYTFSDTAVSTVLELEYANAWYSIANSIYEKIKNGNKVKLNKINTQYIKDSLLTAEDENIKMTQDIFDSTKRLQAARDAFDLDWHLSTIFNSYAALGLIKGSMQVESKETITDLKTESQILINALERKLDEKNAYVWPQLYLQHAKYYFNYGNYLLENEQINIAKDSFQTSLGMALLSQSLIEGTGKIFETLEASGKEFEKVEEITETDLIVIDAKTPKEEMQVNKKITIVTGTEKTIQKETKEENSPLLPIGLAIIAICLIVIILAMRTKKKNKIKPHRSREPDLRDWMH